MGLRSLVVILVVQTLLLDGLNARSVRERRDASITVDNNPNKREVVIYSASSPLESNSYHPPLLAAPPAASVARAVNSNGYQPPLLSAQSNDYKPLISSSQTQSIRYHAPGNNFPIQGLPLVYSQSQPSESSQSYSAPLLASAQTGSVNTVSLQQGSRQGFAYSGDHGPSNNFNHQPPLQAESKPAPASVPSNGNGNRQNAEYVVYYYYYYDNDTAANGSSNFDDIPSLESYDTNKSSKEPEKSASGRTLAADVNALGTNEQDLRRVPDRSISSQPRSASSAGSPNQPPFIRSDKPSLPDELAIQPLKPVSNVFRYGTNEVPRFPILPNFVVSETPAVLKTGIAANPDLASDDIPTTPANVPSSFSGSHVVHVSENESDDDNDVLDQPVDAKSEENKIAAEEPSTTTTTEAPTTTEIPTTTTTEKSRRRPGTGNRRRFNPSPSFAPNRRQGSSRSSSTSTSTTTTTPSSGSPSTRSSFRGSNRVRSRPTIASTRPRSTLSRSAPSVSDNEDSAPITVSVSSSTTIRPRFGASSPAPRRFSSTRTRTQPVVAPVRSPTSTTTTIRPRSAAPRPRPNLISSRSRPARPGLFRSRTPAEPEEEETTTAVPEPVTEEESPQPSANLSPSAEENETDEDAGEDDETSNTEGEEPTTTEKSRFSALFRPRNRSTLNRPKPPVARRSR